MKRGKKVKVTPASASLMDDMTSSISVRIEIHPDARKKLKVRAAAEGRTATAIILRALEAYYLTPIV